MRLSACLSVCLCVCLPACLPACLPVCLSVCLYVYLSDGAGDDGPRCAAPRPHRCELDRWCVFEIRVAILCNNTWLCMVPFCTWHQYFNLKISSFFLSCPLYHGSTRTRHFINATADLLAFSFILSFCLAHDAVCSFARSVRRASLQPGVPGAHVQHQGVPRSAGQKREYVWTGLSKVQYSILYEGSCAFRGRYDI